MYPVAWLVGLLVNDDHDYDDDDVGWYSCRSGVAFE